MLFSAFAMYKQQVFTSHKSELHLFPVLSESFFSSSALRIHQSDPRRHLFAESDLPTVILKKIQILLRRPLMLEADACNPQDP